MSKSRFAAGVLGVVTLMACEAASPPGSAEDASAPSIVAAELKDGTITQQEVDEWLKQALWEQRVEQSDASELYQLRSQALEGLIEERLLESAARRAEVSVEQLVEREVQSSEVAEAEVRAFYDENQARFGGATYEDVGPRIQAYLESAQNNGAREAYVASLREEAGVKIRLEPTRMAVEPIGPAKGPANAPITIVEFSDYECPYCQRAEPTIKQVLERYPNQIRFIYRHYPLGFHARAKPAAEAAACADDQGKFWEFHEKIFSDGGQLSDADFERVAAASGLEVDGFKACMAEGRFKDRVAADIEAAEELGVNGTPAFFVNGIPLSGAQPLDAFVQVIDAELERAGSGS